MNPPVYKVLANDEIGLCRHPLPPHNICRPLFTFHLSLPAIQHVLPVLSCHAASFYTVFAL